MRAWLIGAWYGVGLAYALLSIALDTLWLQTEVDTPYWLALRWLVAPWGLALYGLWCWLDARFRASVRVWWRHLLLWLWAALAALVSGGYVSAANHLLRTPQPVVVRGEVIHLGQLSGRFGGRQHLVTLRRADGSSVRLSIPLAEHEALRIGDRYARDMLRGALGILYRVD